MNQKINDLTPEEAMNLINENSGNSNFVVIDVRTAGEYSSGRLVENAVLLDIYSPDFISKVESLDKDKVYLIYCRTGSRSSAALDLFRRLGFKEAYNLLGGIMYWQELGFEIV